MTESPSPQPRDESLMISTDAGSVQVEATPVPNDRGNVGEWTYRSLVPRQLKPDRLVLELAPGSRYWPRVEALYCGIGMLVFSAILFVLALPFLWLQGGDPALPNRPWTRYALDAWAALFVSGGLAGTLGTAVCWLRRKADASSRWAELLHLLQFPASLLFGGACFAYARERSLFEIRLWLDLAAFTVACFLSMLAGGCVLFAPLGTLGMRLRPFRIFIDVRNNWIGVEEGIDFPKFQCRVNEILAVQVLKGTGQTAAEPVMGFQVNVVLNNTTTPRVSLCEYASLEPARDVGRSLAGFLKVPLLEQIAAAA